MEESERITVTTQQYRRSRYHCNLLSEDILIYVGRRWRRSLIRGHERRMNLHTKHIYEYPYLFLRYFGGARMITYFFLSRQLTVMCNPHVNIEVEMTLKQLRNFPQKTRPRLKLDRPFRPQRFQ